MEAISFTIVIVTYNRIDCLKKALECYENQDLKPACVLVVNNASTDSTYEYLSEWKSEITSFEKIVINNSVNLGGAGGFATGVKAAIELSNDFIFVADDDAYPDRYMLKMLSDGYQKINDNRDVASICTSVVNYGKYDYVHRRKIRKGLLSIKKIFSNDSDYQKDFFQINEFSFVGAAFKTDIAKEAGIPREDFFIYFDDTEYSHRIEQYGRIICIPTSVMNHNVASGHDDNLVTWRSYYSLRNSLIVLKKYYPLRYFCFEAAKNYIVRTTMVARIIKKRTKSEIRLLRDAIRDAYHNSTGISEKYRPGAKLK